MKMNFHFPPPFFFRKSSSKLICPLGCYQSIFFCTFNIDEGERAYASFLALTLLQLIVDLKAFNIA